MPKRNHNRTMKKPRKYSNGQNKKFIQKIINKWQCRVCHQLNDDNYAFCIQCYLNLHYYAYINMHMFVKSDNSYQSIYYHINHKNYDDDQQTSQHSNDSQSQKQSELDHLNIGWVENLLLDQ